MAEQSDPYTQFSRRFPELADLGSTYANARALHIDLQERQARGDVASGKRRQVHDPQKYAKLRAEVLKLEQEKQALSRGDMSDLEKFAMEQAIDLVKARYQNNTEVQKALTKAKTDIGSINLTESGRYNKYRTSSNRLSGEGKLFDNIAKAMSQTEKEGKGTAPGDSPMARELVRKHFSVLKPYLQNVVNSEDPLAQATPVDLQSLAELQQMDDFFSAQNQVLTNLLGDENLQLAKASLATSKQLQENTPANVEEASQNIINSLPQGVSGAPRMTKDVLAAYKNIKNTVGNVSEQTRRGNIPIEAAYDRQISLIKAREEGDPFSLQDMIKGHSNFEEVARVIGVDPLTEQGKRATIGFIREAGKTYYDSARGTADALRDLKQGKLNFDRFFEEKKKQEAAGQKSFTEAVDQNPSVPAYLEDQMDAAEAPPPSEVVPEVAPEVDLLADEEEDMVFSPDSAESSSADLSPAERSANAALAETPEEEILDVVQEEEDTGEFADLINTVSDRENPPSPEFADAFGQSPARQVGPGAPDLVSSFKATQSRDALTDAVQEQARQKVLSRLAGSAQQLPTANIAEEVKGQSAAAYQKALEMAASPTVEAQRIAADTLYDNVSGDPVPGREYADDGALYGDEKFYRPGETIQEAIGRNRRRR